MIVPLARRLTLNLKNNKYISLKANSLNRDTGVVGIFSISQ